MKNSNSRLKCVTVGRGLPPPHKIGCYTLIAKWKFLGSAREFLGWPHRDVQGILVLLVGVYLGPMTARYCLTQPSPREDHTHFSVVCIPHPLVLGFWNIVACLEGSTGGH